MGGQWTPVAPERVQVVDSQTCLVFFYRMPRLHPLQRAYLLGFRRAQARARRQARAAAHAWEAELALLQADLAEIATGLHRERVERAIDEAVIERSAMSPGALLH